MIGVQRDELHLGDGDLLAEVFGGPPDHEAGDEQADQRDQHEAVEAGAEPAEHDLAEQHVQDRHEAADRRVAVVHRVVGAGGAVGGGDRGQHRAADPEADLLALHVAAGLKIARRVVHPLGGQGMAALLGHVAHEEARREQHEPSPRTAPSPARAGRSCARRCR